MCAISASIVKSDQHKYWDLLVNSEIRGQDGTGFLARRTKNYYIVQKSSNKASLSKDMFINLHKDDTIIGQNRLAIFGLEHENDQPLTTERTGLVHNGNLLNFERVFEEEGLERKYKVDSELILRLWEKYFDPKVLFEKLQGNYACIILDKTFNQNRKRKLIAFTKHKPLYYHEDDTGLYFYSTDRIGMKTFGVPGTQLKNYEVITKTIT